MKSATKKAVRPKARSEASKVVIHNEDLSPGDQIEFGVTAEVKKNGRSFWVKGGAVITIRPDEDTHSAKQRVSEFVIAMVDEQISDYLA